MQPMTAYIDEASAKSRDEELRRLVAEKSPCSTSRDASAALNGSISCLD
jgi:hypothetical protein